MKAAAAQKPAGADRFGGQVFTALFALITASFFVISYWTDDDYIIKLPLLSVGVLLIAIFWLIKKMGDRQAIFSRTPLDLWVLGFLAVAVIATLTSVDRSVSFWGQYTRYEGLVAYASYAGIFFLAAQTVRDLKQLRTMAKVVAGAGGAISVFALLQYFGHGLLPWAPSAVEAERAFATFGNPVMLGGFLVLVLPLALFSFFSEKGPAAKAWLGISSLILLAIVVTFTRGSWLGAAAALGIWLVLARRPITESKKWPALAVLLVVLVLGLAFFTASPSSTLMPGQRFASLFRFEEGSAGSRLEIWKTALSATRARPVFGYGPDTFAYAFLEHKTQGYTRLAPQDFITDNAHNYWLQLSATMGLAGLLAFAGLVVGFSVATGKELAGAPPEKRVWLGAAAAAVVGYLVHMSFAVGDIPSTALFWLIMGATAGTLAAARRSPSTATDLTRGVELAAVSVGLVAFAVLLVLQIKMFTADVYFGRAESRMNVGDVEQATAAYVRAVQTWPRTRYYQGLGQAFLESFRQNPEDGGLLEASVDALKTAVKLAPLDVDARLLLADVYRLAAPVDAGYLTLALEELKQAERLEPLSGDAQTLQGVVYAQLGEGREARRRFERARDIRPDSADSYLNLAVYYTSAGQKKKARSLYQKALELDPNNEQARRALTEKTDNN